MIMMSRALLSIFPVRGIISPLQHVHYMVRRCTPYEKQANQMRTFGRRSQAQIGGECTNISSWSSLLHTLPHTNIIQALKKTETRLTSWNHSFMCNNKAKLLKHLALRIIPELIQKLLKNNDVFLFFLNNDEFHLHKNPTNLMKIEKPRLKNWGKNTNRETELSKKKKYLDEHGRKRIREGTNRERIHP